MSVSKGRGFLYRLARLLGDGGHYTAEQKSYALRPVDEFGVRATARILKLPRRTLQRWCRKYNKHVKHCPAWVFEWQPKGKDGVNFGSGEDIIDSKCRHLKSDMV